MGLGGMEVGTEAEEGRKGGKWRMGWDGMGWMERNTPKSETSPSLLCEINVVRGASNTQFSIPL